jgi:ABC-2 type transport system ATP-binding protein
MTKMSEPAIEIRNLTKKFEDKTALNSISLEVGKGELFGLLGPNGAGKTTTLNILCGLVKPTNGTAKIYSHDVQTETQKVKELIGVCPQETAIYPYLSGAENLELFGNLHCMNKKLLKERSKLLLSTLGLKEDAKRVTAKYSGGMKRRLSLALALIHDPQVVFLDEPTVAMDPQSRHAVWDFIKNQKTKGKTVVLTTHYMEEAEELCDRVGIIDRGKFIAQGTPKELIAESNVKNLEELFIKLTGRTIREES